MGYSGLELSFAAEAARDPGFLGKVGAGGQPSFRKVGLPLSSFSRREGNEWQGEGMSIRQTILGFLSWKPFTGYELKKFFEDALSFHWSGNNNQIYGTLVELHKDGAVSVEVRQQEKLPAKKVYSITEQGKAELREWLLSEPELPSLRSMAHAQLAWAESLSGAELSGLMGSYERQLEAQVLMCRERARRGGLEPARSPREELVWKRIEEGNIALYERELDWVRALRRDIEALGEGNKEGSA